MAEIHVRVISHFSSGDALHFPVGAGSVDQHRCQSASITEHRRRGRQRGRGRQEGRGSEAEGLGHIYATLDHPGVNELSSGEWR